ncbi:NAC domain-containing protein 60 [Morus notabilis]|uniref:NAC domain-containing protein 60 n=1 Tax=Morus notabilis TaxID=981085 RepID=UPI000CED5FC6|nr:NAC domain-containing protein 60 [Morus notabilis]
MAGAPSREAQMSIAALSMFPGFRFSPTDEELISYYLKNKMDGADKSVEVIPEVEIWKYEPWELLDKSVIPSETEWFFFSPRGRKYPNGSQSKRATELGYWKATGKERNVKSGSTFIGTKRTLVFHTGRAPKGERTEWIMHEYCVLDKSQDFMVVCRLRKNSEFRLNDSNRASSSQRPLSTMHNSNCAASEVGTEPGDKANECCSKKCSSSYDSYSIEQIDSASESSQKLASEVTQPECSGQQKDYDDDDDFFAEILKDDIIKLDETLISAALDISPLAAFVPEEVQKSQQPGEAAVSQDLPFQGTANRRIRLKKETVRTNREKAMENTASTKSDYLVGKNTRPNSKESPKCSASVLSARTTASRHLILAVFLLLAFMALFASLLGGFWRVRMTICESFYRGCFLR